MGVQKSSDGNRYTKIGWIEGQGDSQLEVNYQFEDRNVLPNTQYYYRFKQISTDGNFEYSEVVTATRQSDENVYVGDFYPNPVGKAKPKLDIRLANPASVEVLLYSSTGELMHRQQRQYTEGKHTMRLRWQNPISGVYYAKIQVGETVIYKRLIIK